MPTPDDDIVDPELDLDTKDDDEDELDDFGEPLKVAETKDDSFGRSRR